MSAALVVIGASLGGVPALRRALKGVTRSLQAAVLFVQHRRGGYQDRLGSMLEGHVELDIQDVESHQQLREGSLFLAPADYHVLIDRGRLELTTDELVHHARPSIDVAFESAARAYGARLLAILLTGASADGAEGLAFARSAGATTFVQEPSGAESPIAPQAALERDGAHRVLDLEGMADAIMAWSARLRF